VSDTFSASKLYFSQSTIIRLFPRFFTTTFCFSRHFNAFKNSTGKVTPSELSPIRVILRIFLLRIFLLVIKVTISTWCIALNPGSPVKLRMTGDKSNTYYNRYYNTYYFLQLSKASEDNLCLLSDFYPHT